MSLSPETVNPSNFEIMVSELEEDQREWTVVIPKKARKKNSSHSESKNYNELKKTKIGNGMEELKVIVEFGEHAGNKLHPLNLTMAIHQ